MNLWKRWFSNSGDAIAPIAPLSDREYERLFLQLLQGVAANWDGERLLRETANPDFFGAVSISIIEFAILQKFWNCFNKNV